MARSAARLARTNDPDVAAHARAYLAESMGELRGLPQKLGQILSMREGCEAAAFAPLTGSARPLAFAHIEAALEREWEQPWRRVLSELEPEGHAASLGQVHRARLPSGEPVAVKVQYPGIEDAVQADLRLLGWLTLPVGGLGRGFDMKAYREEILRDLDEELDYRREAEQQRRFAGRTWSGAQVIVPEIVDALSTGHVLVSRWEDGLTLRDVAETWPEPQRRAAGRLFLSTVLEALFRHGEVQGDLHPGNFRFRRGAAGQPQLVLYDFGCVFRPPPTARLALLNLIRIAGTHSTADPLPSYLAMGFREDYLEPLADKLPALTRVLLEPFLVPGEFDTARWDLGERVSGILGDDRWNFRVAGPPSLILLMRVMHGLLHTLRTLRGPVSWSAALDPILESERPALDRLRLPRTERPEHGFGRMARHLRLEVVQGLDTKVRLTSPLRVVDALEDAMGEDLARSVRQRGIDIDALVRRIRASGYVPQEVFSLTDGAKRVRVWLE